MPLAPAGADTFVAQNMSKLRECRAVPLGADFPDSGTWLPTFTLQRIFAGYLDTGGAPFAFMAIRSALAALEAYDDGCRLLADYVAAPELQVGPYFKCLGRFETAISAVAKVLAASLRITKQRAFEERDGSPHERLNWLYNTMKHTTANLPVGLLQPTWLENDGVHGVQVEKGRAAPRTDVVTFDEIREFVHTLCVAAKHYAAAGPLPPVG